MEGERERKREGGREGWDGERVRRGECEDINLKVQASSRRVRRSSKNMP